jgi:hypothetical protein
MSIGATHEFGWKNEEELKPRLEELFGEPLAKFNTRFATYDFETSDYLIELKSRMPPVSEDTYDTWMIPACKFVRNDKQIAAFYFFEQTKSLYYIIYDEEQFKSYKKIKNRNGQMTYHIPRSEWTKV